MPSLTSWVWLGLEAFYSRPAPPKRVRPKDKPMQVICVGLPRSGTESLQQALMRLGYDYTYHGWDIIFEEPCYAQQWSALARRKFFGDQSGECDITAADFDELLGHSTAVTDAASSVFAREMILAYPEAKVVLNVRRDLDKWHRSAIETLVDVNESRILWLMTFLAGGDAWWSWHAYERLLWPGLFRSLDGSLDTGIRRNGKWVYREHCDMIRGMLRHQPDRLLEWSVEDGWEPLCKFLNKSVPVGEPFPNVNSAGVGWQDRQQRIMKRWTRTVVFNVGLFVAVLSAGISLARRRADILDWISVRARMS